MTERRAASLVILTPVLDDWTSLNRLAQALANLPLRNKRIHIVVLDDGSASEIPPSVIANLCQLGDASIVHLGRTVGHQRAIAFGLRHIVNSMEFDWIIVMDADGEDPPQALPVLLQAAVSNPNHIIVARRGRRSERPAFRIGYRSYRLLFRALVGLHLNFGNFVLLPSTAARRIASEESLWLNFPATVARSLIPKVEVVVDRSSRFDGVSRMNRYALVTHGLGAMAVFADRIFIRVVAASASALALSLLVLGAVVYARLRTSAAVPGWATTAAGLSILFAGQVLTTSLLTMFVMLQQRLSMLPVLARFSEADVASVRTL